MEAAAQNPSIDVLIRSYYRDLDWLSVALTSIRAFVTNIRTVIVVLPESTLARVDCRARPALRDVDLRACQDFTDDYVGQQITKLHADEYSDADVILHVDSDSVFVAPCDAARVLFDAGRLRVTCDRRGARPASDGWRRSASLFMRQEIDLDIAGPSPAAFPRHLYGALRSHCQTSHGRSIDAYASALRGDRFSEFALLRGFALLREPDAYAWIDLAEEPYLPQCRTFWSRAQTPRDVMPDLPEPLRTLLAATLS